MKKLLSVIIVLLFSVAPAQQKLKNYDQIMKSKSIYEIDAFLRDAIDKDPRRTILKKRLLELIANYIKTARPDDQAVKGLQEKLAMLQRRPSTKITFDEMNEKIKQKQIARYQEELARLQNLSYSNPVASNNNQTSTGTRTDTNSESYKEAVRRADELAAKDRAKGTAQNTSSPARVPVSQNINYAASASMSTEEEQEFQLLMNSSPTEHKLKTVQILNKLFDNDPSSKDCIVMIQNKSDCNMIVRIEGTGNTKYRLAVPANNEGSIVILKGDYLFTSLVCGAQYASQKTVQKAIMVALANPK